METHPIFPEFFLPRGLEILVAMVTKFNFTKNLNDL